VVNDEGKRKRFPLEAFIRTLGTEKNGYVVGVLDCCREKLSLDMRGAGGLVKDSMAPEDNPNYRNTFITFACEAKSGV
jgi:hypothetical protein